MKLGSFAHASTRLLVTLKKPVSKTVRDGVTSPLNTRLPFLVYIKND